MRLEWKNGRDDFHVVPKSVSKEWGAVEVVPTLQWRAALVSVTILVLAFATRAATPTVDCGCLSNLPALYTTSPGIVPDLGILGTNCFSTNVLADPSLGFYNQTPFPGTWVSCGTNLIQLTVIDTNHNFTTCTVPFVVMPPSYEEAEGDPVAHAIGKAESVLPMADDEPVLGCDTEVVCEGRVFGKPESSADAEEMLESLAGKTHEVVSGLALITPGWREVHREVTLVTFRTLDARDLAHYLASREWEGRAGAYAIQGLGASLVERIEGDYLNVVVLPAALLVRLLAQHFPGVYGFG